MIYSPPPNPNVEVIFDNDATDYTPTDSQKSASRNNTCKTCEKFITVDDITKCSDSGLDINLMISAIEISCPAGKWK